MPRIPLGSRGRLKGEAWEVVGYQVRRTIADVPFTWFEHLLHNPTHGFRWLVEVERPLGAGQDRLAGCPVPSRRTRPSYLGDRYHHFQTAKAETVARARRVSLGGEGR